MCTTYGLDHSYTVLSATQAIDVLIGNVQALGLHHGLENSLLKKLQNAQNDLAKGNTANAITLEFTTARQFLSWLTEQQASIVPSTYQAGKLFLLGRNTNGEMSQFNRTFNRCMGLHVSIEHLFMSSVYISCGASITVPALPVGYCSI